jgi:hypothetical protein
MLRCGPDVIRRWGVTIFTDYEGPHHGSVTSMKECLDYRIASGRASIRDATTNAITDIFLVV